MASRSMYGFSKKIELKNPVFDHIPDTVQQSPYDVFPVNVTCIACIDASCLLYNMMEGRPQRIPSAPILGDVTEIKNIRLLSLCRGGE